MKFSTILFIVIIIDPSFPRRYRISWQESPDISFRVGGSTRSPATVEKLHERVGLLASLGKKCLLSCNGLYRSSP